MHTAEHGTDLRAYTVSKALMCILIRMYSTASLMWALAVSEYNPSPPALSRITDVTGMNYFVILGKQ